MATLAAPPSAVAENRFGLGARPDVAPPSDVEGWLKAQLKSFVPNPPALAQGGDTPAIIRMLADYRNARQQAKRAGNEAALAAAKQENPVGPAYRLQASARLSTAVTTDTPFAERLVHFWANHFAVSVDKEVTRGLAGCMEFEAIRPNMGKHFVEMWLAVMEHPAMLLYLDQAQSIGPDSAVARLAALRGGKTLGLNENLAREAMELHSLGVRTGYTQADVTELARALTGWTVSGFARGPAAKLFQGAPDGKFYFVEAMHQPGARTVLGKRYHDDGPKQALGILVDLAQRPETANHIATKLARHFIADDPPPSAVKRLARVFQETQGHLPSLHAALVDLPETWETPMAKFKSPWDWTVSALRAVGAPGADVKAVGAVAELGQPIWRPGSPAGWDDSSTAWAAPDAVLRRVEVAMRLGQVAPQTLDARAYAPRLLGAVSASTARVIATAPSAAQGIALLLASPEFQRR
jgi:uncharacterized protein (DUF1800 family)